MIKLEYWLQVNPPYPSIIPHFLVSKEIHCKGKYCFSMAHNSTIFLLLIFHFLKYPDDEPDEINLIGIGIFSRGLPDEYLHNCERCSYSFNGLVRPVIYSYIYIGSLHENFAALTQWTRNIFTYESNHTRFQFHMI